MILKSIKISIFVILEVYLLLLLVLYELATYVHGTGTTTYICTHTARKIAGSYIVHYTAITTILGRIIHSPNYFYVLFR